MEIVGAPRFGRWFACQMCMRVRTGACGSEDRCEQWIAMALANGAAGHGSCRPNRGLAGRVVVERCLARAAGAEAVPTTTYHTPDRLVQPRPWCLVIPTNRAPQALGLWAQNGAGATLMRETALLLDSCPGPLRGAALANDTGGAH